MSASGMPLLRADDGLSAVVLDHLIRRGGDGHARSVIGPHPDDVEGPAAEHAGVAAGPRADRQLLSAVVPGELDLGMLAALVVVRVAFVFVERERSALSL